MSFNGIERIPVEGFYSEVLLNPLEKQFYLPPLFVELSNLKRRELEVIGEKDETGARL